MVKLETFRVAVRFAERVRPSSSVTCGEGVVAVMVFVTCPGVEDVTVTVRVQVNPALMLSTPEEPVQVIVLRPVPGLRVPFKQFALLVTAFVVVTPAGRLSVTLTLCKAVSLGAMILIVMTLVPPGAMLAIAAPLNCFEPVIGTALAETVRLAVLEATELQIAPLLKHTLPMGMVFVYAAGTVLVTWKETVQVPPGPATIVPPVRVITFGEPLTATVPPHCEVAGVPKTVRLVDDRVSVMDTP